MFLYSWALIFDINYYKDLTQMLKGHAHKLKAFMSKKYYHIAPANI